MKVLLVEDEIGIAQFIHQGLNESGYVVDIASDGSKGLHFVELVTYDLIILDLMLPKVDGFEFLKEIRKRKIHNPILVLTARQALEDRIKGLDLGADDYLVKPFAFSELLARLRALQRRPPLQIDTVLKFANLTMDLTTREVKREGKLIDLSPLEFRLLEYLLQNPNQVLTRTQIGEHIWNLDFYHNSNIVDVYIGYLRRKIDRNHTPQLIHTIRGVGYSLKVVSNS